tara:strand:- start:1188 stop:1460 length:273 start_codon:yes stop_codon:yes gene_type:complete
MADTAEPEALPENPLPQGACAIMSIRDLEDLIESIKKDRRAWGIKRVAKHSTVCLNIDIEPASTGVRFSTAPGREKRYWAKITRSFKVSE